MAKKIAPANHGDSPTHLHLEAISRAPYGLDKLMLRRVHMLGGLEQLLLTEEVERTIKKIEAMVSPWSLNRSIQLSFYDWEGRSEILETLKTCQASIAKKRLVSFHYTDKDGTVTNRRIEPYELHFSESSWYLRGFCLHRQGYEHHRTLISP